MHSLLLCTLSLFLSLASLNSAFRPCLFTLTQSHTHTHSLSLVLVVMIKSKELKSKISHTHSLILSHCALPQLVWWVFRQALLISIYQDSSKTMAVHKEVWVFPEWGFSERFLGVTMRYAQCLVLCFSALCYSVLLSAILLSVLCYSALFLGSLCSMLST